MSWVPVLVLRLIAFGSGVAGLATAHGAKGFTPELVGLFVIATTAWAADKLLVKA